VDVLVVIGVLALLVAIVIPALQRHRLPVRANRVVCLNNLRQLTLAWIIYADENDDRIVNGAAGIGRPNEPAWVPRDWDPNYMLGKQLSDRQQEGALKLGALWTYCKNLKLYRCPSGIQGEMRTYSIVDSMNGYPQPDNPRGRGPKEAIKTTIIKKIKQISNPYQRPVFIDVGWAPPGSYAVYYDKEKWWDPPPVRHRDGTNISFADGHVEYWKWKGKETIKLGRTASRTRSPSNVTPQSTEGKEDLHKLQKAAWGQLGYEPKQ